MCFAERHGLEETASANFSYPFVYKVPNGGNGNCSKNAIDPYEKRLRIISNKK